MINHKDVHNVELVAIIPFKEKHGGREEWYFELKYCYVDSKGKHLLHIPKVRSPFVKSSIPPINEYDPDYGVALATPYINCNDTCELLLAPPVYEARMQGVTNIGYCFDVVTEPVTRKMTLKEIEDELGYKVEIIDKENNNA